MDKELRAVKFGQALSILDTLYNQLFNHKQQLLTKEKFDRFAQRPVDGLMELHKDVMQYAPQFKPSQGYLFKMLEEIISSLDDDEYTNDPLDPKFLYGYYKKNTDLDMLAGVDYAADILNLSPGTVKNKCASGEIPAKKIGKTWIMDKNDLIKIKGK
ncbi:helix-turn-helix domain-containing protein [Sporolactobacillus kofuensis]|uniref:Helix-turn-helix domain-containing protein n=1 Tax=Sporolactobacillus kofuensis TaxID=269672 RepID=A0ABW1WD74_9BACL|nr:helix-turn-helix domain-containing protein [Sporolactobacillus kofuensis]MCO7175570.1 helix-turn-helix domain-containing protein [Sporolactobacillus kofuensis]